MAGNGRIEELKNPALSAVRGAETTAALEEARVRYLGRSAELTEIKKSIGALPPEERREVGRSANLASREIEGALEARTEELSAAEREARLRAEAVDVTLPGVPHPRGHLHPPQRLDEKAGDFLAA